MKTPKCPLCGGSFELFEEGANIYLYQCLDCPLASSVSYTEKGALENAKELISKFPPIMRVWPGDKVKLYEDRHPKKIIGKNADRGILYLETASGPPEPVRQDDVELWPWEIEQTEKISKSCDNGNYCTRPSYKSPCLECVDCEDEAYKYWELDQKGGDE